MWRTGWTFVFGNLLPRGERSTPTHEFPFANLTRLEKTGVWGTFHSAIRFPCQRVFTCRLTFRDVANLPRFKPLRVLNLFENSLDFAWPEFARLLTLWIPNGLFSAIIRGSKYRRSSDRIDRSPTYLIFFKYKRVSAILISCNYDWIGTKRR